MSAPGLARRLGGTVRDLVIRVLVEPVRDGRIRSAGWPAGLAPAAVVAAVGIATAVVLVLFSGELRAHLRLEVVASGSDALLPRAVVWIVFALTCLSVSLVQTAALHASPWLRWSITGFTALVVLLMAVPDGGGLPLGRTVAIVACVWLVILVAIRGHRGYAWWEFPVVVALVWGSTMLNVAWIAVPARGAGFDFTPLMLSLVMVTLAQLAIPGAIAAGTAMAELAIATGTWTITALRERIGMVAVWIAVALAVALLGLGVVDSAAEAAADPGALVVDLLGSLVALVIVQALWMLLHRVRPPGAPPVGIGGLIDELGPIALAVAAILSPTILGAVVQLVGLVATSFGAPPEVQAATGAVHALAGYEVVNAARGLGGLGLVVAAIVLARRGRGVLPELLVAIGVCGISFGLTVAVGIEFTWSDDALAVLGAAGALVALGVAALRRAATPDRVAAAAIVVAACALFTHRELIADPLVLVIGAAGAAVVLIGQLWNLFTGSAAANRDSRRYPRPSRVLFALGTVLFALTVLAYGALGRDPDAIVDLGAFAEIGDELFGHALLLTAIVAGLRGVVAGRPPD